MAYIQFHQALVSHHKLGMLCETLGVKRPQAAGHLAFLWCWALDNAKDGNLTHISGRAIADAAGWTKKPEALVAGLRKSGFLCSRRCEHETPDEETRLHDWYEYAGKLIDRRKSDADRKKLMRASSGHPTDGVSRAAESSLEEPIQEQQRAARPEADVLTKCGALIDRAAGSLLMTPTLYDQIAKWIGEANLTRSWRHSGEPVEWFEAACASATGAEGFRKAPWPYLRKILNRWLREGFQADNRPKPNAASDDPHAEEHADAQRRAAAR